jgi:hypothetical protein
MTMATGDGLWGDRVERACFNAGMGAVKKDWKGAQYFSCPNQFLATQNSDHNAMNLGHQMMSYSPTPATPPPAAAKTCIASSPTT